MSRSKSSAAWAATTAIAAMLLCGEHAQAHIKMLKPMPMYMENGRGDPQNSGPCGGTGTRSNVVTEFHGGETIMVEWSVTMAHPGHYRIALAKTASDLKDPDVPLDGNCNYEDGAYDDKPLVYPVLADHLFPFDQAEVSAPDAQRMFQQEVTLPKEPCDKCVLQVIQFMTVHAPPCSYYHCAEVSIVAADPASESGGAGGAAAAPPAPASGAGAGGMGGVTLATGMTGVPSQGAGGMSAGPMAPSAPAATGNGGSAAPSPLPAAPAASTPPATPSVPAPKAAAASEQGGCSAAGDPSPGNAAAFALVALLGLRRRRSYAPV